MPQITLQITSQDKLKDEICRLIDVAEKTRSFWQQPIFTVFHHLVSSIVSQKIRFEQGREIRNKLYSLIREKYPDAEQKNGYILLTPENVKPFIDLLSHSGLDSLRTETLKRLVACGDFKTSEEYKIKGISKWTINAVNVIMLKKPDVVLDSDKYIQKILKILLRSEDKIGAKDVKEFFSKITKNQRTVVTYFLWRIKPEGMENYINFKDLSRKDFV